MFGPPTGALLNHRQTWKSTSSRGEESPKAAPSGMDCTIQRVSVIVCPLRFVYDADKAILQGRDRNQP